MGSRVKVRDADRKGGGSRYTIPPKITHPLREIPQSIA